MTSKLALASEHAPTSSTVFDHFGIQFGTLFQDRSDRACVVAAGAWIDTLLRTALDGETLSRRQPSNLAGRIELAFELGWINDDLRFDLQVIRGLRNDFAHSPDADSLEGERLDAIIQALRVPSREYNDWGSVRVAAMPRGFTMFTGEAPPGAGEPMYIGPLLFRMAIEVILVVLIGSLPLGVQRGATGEISRFELADYLRGIAQAD